MDLRSTRLASLPGRLVRTAAAAGLFEGLAIARHEVLQRDLERLPAALAYALAILVAQLVLWSALGLAAARRFGPVGSLRSVFFLWTSAVVVGRYSLADRLPSDSWSLPLAGLAIVLLVPDRLWGAASGRVGDAVALLGVALVGTASLVGLVPDNSYAASDVGFFYSSVALATLALLLAAPRWPKSLAAVLLAAGIVAPFAARARPEPNGPNVLFVLMDTTRRDHVPPFGDLVREPTITRLASEGVRFDQAITVVPKTPESVASFWTGLYPYQHGVRGLHDRLAPEHATLGSVFRRAGYKTAALIDNGWLTRGRGFDNGFERFTGYYELGSPYGAWTAFSWLRLADQLTVRRIPRFSPQVRASRLTGAAIAALERYRERRFFLYVHYFEPHWPYFPPADKARLYGGPADGRTVVNLAPQLGLSRGQLIFQNPLAERDNEAARRLYRGEVDDTLAEIERLLSRLAELGLERETLVVFTADHGHALGEHDYYFHHGEFLYDDSLRIPLVLRWPGRLPRGLVIPAQVRSIDLAPTLYQLTRTPGPAKLGGRSLTRFLEAPGDPGLPAFVESDILMFKENTRRDIPGIAGKMRAIRTPHRKLILNPRLSGLHYELYDLDRDPQELVDLSARPEHGPELAELQQRLWALIPGDERATILAATAAGASPTEEDQGSATDLEQLRSLGYIN